MPGVPFVSPGQTEASSGPVPQQFVVDAPFPSCEIASEQYELMDKREFYENPIVRDLLWDS